MPEPKKLYCDMNLRAVYWKRDPVHGIGKVCNTPVEPGKPCPNKHKHQ